MEHNLEVGLYRWDATQYGVDLRYEAPGQPSEIRPKQSQPVRFDWTRLTELAGDSQQYGELLWQTILADDAVQGTFEQARAAAMQPAPGTQQPAGLRVRLYISANAPELHALRWETLRNPTNQSWLSTNEATLFSRYLLCTEWRTVVSRAVDANELRVVLAVAAPEGLPNYRPHGQPLAEIDAPRELERARRFLAADQVVELSPVAGADGEPARRATLANLADALRAGTDVLYLVCHGALLDQEPVLYLEDEAGQVKPVVATTLLNWWRDLKELPRLVVLVSCQSAGDGGQSSDNGALAALGPRLVAAGVPAVVAMQGNIQMDTAAAFTETFLRELRGDGVIDRAMAVARGAVRDRSDWWMPVLFMRLKTGRLWDNMAFRVATDFAHWDTLVTRLRKGECTPIIGSGVLEPLIGDSRVLARRWAEIYRFPLAPHDRDDLPQVAQYLEVAKDRQFPRDELEFWLRQLLLRAEGGNGAGRGATVDELLVAAGEALAGRVANEAHRLLAGLPFHVYLTTNADSLLTHTLAATPVEGQTKKKPRVRAFGPDEEPLPEDYQPSEAEPLVYHLFGHWQDASSLVLSEDDYFDFLIGIIGKRRHIPLPVRRRLNKASLLFIGFRLDEWDFRVLTRAINAMEGSDLLQNYSHVAVQVDPETSRFLDVENAIDFLQKHTRFAGKQVSLFWGKPEEFLSKLKEHWDAARP